MLILLAKWPLPLNGNVVVLRMYVKCGKGETCVLWFIFRAVVFVGEKVFQNLLNVQRCGIKVVLWALFILLTIVQWLYTH